MRAEEFVADFEGINIAVEEEEDDLMVRAMAGGREMGHAYFVKDGQTLLPQDLEIDPRYQGQGIARVLYDYAKSLGYDIRRSNQQTDAGKAFWQRHKPGQNVWEADTQTATAKQVLAYINQTHHEPLTAKLATAVSSHPRWELRQVPLQNLHIPDQDYEDPEQEPPRDPYDRVMAVDPGHANEYSTKIIDKRPIVIDDQGYIIDGNHRAWAAAELMNRNSIPAWVPVKQSMAENFADGKVKGKSRPGRVKRAGASCNGSVTDLRARAKAASGERAKMYHWCANMKSGKKK
jgi:GNAT superfamily N-acetyltransferase